MAGLVVLGLLLSSLNWLYLADLSGDTGWWLAQAGNVALGYWPYRDFTWLYPPLALWLFGGAFHLFGATFPVANALLDVLSLAIVLAMWNVARRLYGPGLAFSVTAACACVLATRSGILFFLGTYSPAVLVGAIGSLTALAAVLDKIAGRPGPSTALFVLGSSLGLLSKPEYALGTFALLIALAFLDKGSGSRTASWLGLAAATILPALAVYSWIAYRVTWPRLLLGLGGYGMARAACPWWPTGYGLLLNLAAVGRGISILLIIGIFARPRLLSHFAWRPRLWIVAGLALSTLQYWLFSMEPDGRRGALRVAFWFFDPSTLLLPVMAASLILLPWLAWRWFRAGAFPSEYGGKAFAVVLFQFFLISARGWFTASIEPYPTVTAAALFGAFLLMPGFYAIGARVIFGPTDEFADARRRATLCGLLLAYSSLCLIGTFAGTDSRHVPVMMTRAGPLRLGTISPSTREVYSYVAARLGEGEALLDIPYSGGLVFAARLRNPLYQTVHKYIRLPEADREADGRRYEEHPPRLAVVMKGPDFQAANGNIVGCSFPRISFRATALDDPPVTFPVVTAIMRDYRMVADFGDRAVLEYSPGSSSTERNTGLGK